MPKLSFGLLLLGLLLPATMQAQTAVTVVQFLGIEIWPDYDQPAVLLLLTGTLPPDTPLPATVTLPLPAAAQLNAVARISTDNIMSDDIEYQTDETAVTFTTPNLRFRVEYYLPYRSEENGRFFTFTWQSPLLVEQMAVTVQQPAAANEMNLEPTAVNIGQRNDNLTYHNLPSVTVPPNAPYTTQLSYTLDTPRLTVETTAPAATVEPLPASANRQLNIYFILAGASAVFVAGYVGWHLWQRPRKAPKPKRRQKRFCTQCGQAIAAGDKFCRQCGASLK